MNPYLSIILPCHNEETRLPRCLDRTLEWLFHMPYQYEIIPVDNGSTDDTWRIANYYASLHDHIYPIRLKDRGKGHAVRTGMLRARGRYRLFMDVDLSTPLTEIPRALEKIQDSHIVIGSRELVRAHVRTPLHRRLIGRAFHSLVSNLVPGIQDTQCGFKLFRDWSAMKLFEMAHIDGMAFDVEILYLARLCEYRVYEMSVHWTHDPDSRVHLVGDSLSMLWDVMDMPRGVGARYIVPE